MNFEKSLDLLLQTIPTRRDNLVRYLKKHFRLDFDYTIEKNSNGSQHGGRNKITYILTNTTYNLVLNSYNLNKKYPPKIQNPHLVHPIIMSIENATIGFIQRILTDIVVCHRQFQIGQYFVDLYLPEHNLIIECDEFGHKHYCKSSDEQRTSEIKSTLNSSYYRFDPTTDEFDIGQ